jgi:hypothetical protein
MSYGLRIRNAAGQVRLDTSYKLTRLIYSAILPAAETSSIVITGFDSSKGIAITYAFSNDPNVFAHQVKSDGNQVFWRASMLTDSSTRPTGTDSLLLVFMYG